MIISGYILFLTITNIEVKLVHNSEIVGNIHFLIYNIYINIYRYSIVIIVLVLLLIQFIRHFT